MVDWKEYKTEIEVMEEVCRGVQEVSLDMSLNLVCSLIYELEFSLDQVKQRMEEMINATYTVDMKKLGKLIHEDPDNKR